MQDNPLAKPYANRKAIVTGSTRSIGLAVARKLASGGADVVLNYSNDKASADVAVGEIRGMGARCIAIKADMSRGNDCRRLVSKGIEFLGGLDFLVHNAGPFDMATVAEMDERTWRFLVDSNFNAGFHLTQTAIAELHKSDFPSIVYTGGVNTSTIAARPEMAAYSAAKAALAVMMRTVAVEEGPNGIRANMVCPGYIDNGGYSKSFRRRAVKEIPLGRIGKPEDVADVICWLCSREARYVTGAIIDAGGGLWM